MNRFHWFCIVRQPGLGSTIEECEPGVREVEFSYIITLGSTIEECELCFILLPYASTGLGSTIEECELVVISFWH